MSPILLQNSKAFDEVSLASNQLSNIIDLGEADCFACHFVWTDAPVGTVDTYASNSEDPDDFVRIDYMSTAGTPGSHLLNVPKFAWRYIKIGYTKTSGSGTLTAYVSAKRR